MTRQQAISTRSPQSKAGVGLINAWQIAWEKLTGKSYAVSSVEKRHQKRWYGCFVNPTQRGGPEFPHYNIEGHAHPHLPFSQPANQMLGRVFKPLVSSLKARGSNSKNSLAEWHPFVRLNISGTQDHVVIVNPGASTLFHYTVHMYHLSARNRCKYLPSIYTIRDGWHIDTSMKYEC